MIIPISFKVIQPNSANHPNQANNPNQAIYPNKANYPNQAGIIGNPINCDPYSTNLGSWENPNNFDQGLLCRCSIVSRDVIDRSADVGDCFYSLR